MKRYVTKRPARMWWDSDLEMEIPPQPTTMVYEPDEDLEPTGLLNSNGDPLFRQTVREPIGFKLKAR